MVGQRRERRTEVERNEEAHHDNDDQSKSRSEQVCAQHEHGELSYDGVRPRPDDQPSIRRRVVRPEEERRTAHIPSYYDEEAISSRP
jgi:hypothetical protein